jgi:hypothetical protein
MQRTAEMILRYASPNMGPLVVPGIPARGGTGWFGDLSLMWLPWAAYYGIYLRVGPAACFGPLYEKPT